MESVLVDRAEIVREEIRTPRAAGVAGLVFAVVVGAVTIIWRQAVPDASAPPAWVTDASRRRAILLALELIPFAGVAFLWFIGVIRTRLGDREDRLFATAFLGSGVIFVAMLFTGASLMGGLLAHYDGTRPVSADNVQLVTAISTTLLTSFSLRMAAVFTLVVTNLGRRTGILPRWLVLIGFGVALVLFLAPPRTLWATLLFPGWVLILSVHMIISPEPSSGALDSRTQA
jgi:preprotein translocase subunit Sec61beta